MTNAERNRLIKSVLTKAFAPAKVTVRGSRGTATGWVSIHVAYAPKNRDELDTLKSKCHQLFKAAGVTFGTYGYDSPGSDYGFGSCMHLDFDQCRDVFNAGERVTYCGQPGTVKDREYSKGGDWYVVALDAGDVKNDCYKGDLSRVPVCNIS